MSEQPQWEDVMRALDASGADPAKRDALIPHLRARPDTWPSFIEAVNQHVAQDQAAGGGA